MIEPLTQEQLTGFDDEQFAAHQQAMSLEIMQRLRADKEAAEESEEEEITDPRTQIVEVLKPQRLHLERRKADATRHIDSMPGYFPNPYDRETHIEIEYGLRIAMDFVNVTFHGARPNTVTDCAKRMVEAESTNTSKDRLIDTLRDEIEDLNHEIGQLKGQRK